MAKPPREWKFANAKFDERGGYCQNCGTFTRVERAHVIGRSNDYQPPVRMADHGFEWWPGVVHPDRIILLCGPATSTTTCHGMQHNRRLDILPLLTLDEQIQAVADAGGISQAYDKLAPCDSPRRVRAPSRLALPGDD